MKALTLTQPWATLVAIGVKSIETRSWQTSYRGPLAIHAGKGFPAWAREVCETEPFEAALWSDPAHLMNLREETAEDELFPPPVWQFLPTGCIVAVCDLVDIYPTEARVLEFKALNLSFDSEQGFSGGTMSQFHLPPPEPELSFGDYSPGRFAWRLENVRALPVPIPAKGALSLWEWDDTEMEATP